MLAEAIYGEEYSEKNSPNKEQKKKKELRQAGPHLFGRKTIEAATLSYFIPIWTTQADVHGRAEKMPLLMLDCASFYKW